MHVTQSDSGGVSRQRELWRAEEVRRIGETRSDRAQDAGRITQGGSGKVGQVGFQAKRPSRKAPGQKSPSYKPPVIKPPRVNAPFDRISPP